MGDNDVLGTPSYWGVVNAVFGGEGTHGGTNKAYCAAVGFAGTTGSPIYLSDMSAYMLRNIDLTTYTNATLSFWHKISRIEAGYDFVRVLIDDNEIFKSSPTTAQASWSQITLSLEAYVGASHVLKFLFTSDTTEQREGWYIDDVLVTDAFTPGPPPVNNNFANAQVLLGASGSVSGATGSATAEANEPTSGFAATNSVWYRWSGVTNGTVTFNTGGSAVDTLLCIYTGNNVGALTPVQCDDNGGTNGSSLITFQASLGTIYRIQVRAVNNARGGIKLNWSQPAGAGVDLLPDVSLWVDESKGYLYGWYIDKAEPTRPGRTLLRATTASINIGAGTLELRGSSLNPNVYQRIYTSDGGYRDNLAGTFTFHPSHGHLHFDNWLNFNLRAVGLSNAVGNVVAAGQKTSFAIIDLETYNPALPGYNSTSVYEGGLVQGMSIGWADVYTASLPDQWIDVTGVAPGRYWLEALVDPENHVIESNESNNVVRILVDLSLLGITNVVNDNLIDALPITGVTAGIMGSSVGATKEATEPNHRPGNAGGASVWYRWTAPANMNVVISTDGSSFDTVMAVYTGTAYGASFNQVAQDDDGGAGNKSLVSFAATAGTTYRIAVDGYNGQAGAVQLNLNPAANDNLAQALAISGMSGSTSGSSRGATREAGEPLHAGINGTNSIWYSWTAPTNGPFTFDTSGSSFDTVIAIYTGAAFPLTPVASDDNSGTFNAGKVTFNAVANTSYRIAIDGTPGDYSAGIVKLAWNGPLPPVIVTQPVSTNLIAGSTFQFTVGVNGTPPFGYQWRHAGTNLIDDDAHVVGSTTAAIRLGKIFTTDAGAYSVVITNLFGSVTSTPANLIVLDNPRVVYVNPGTAPLGGLAIVPLRMQALGTERTFNFSVVVDPAALGNPRVATGSNTIGANVTLNTSMVASGRLGVTLELPQGQILPSGSELELARLTYDVAANLSPGTQTAVGFVDQPVTKSIITTNGALVTGLFVAGGITLQNWTPSTTGLLTNGTFRLSLNGNPNSRYVVESTTNLSLLNWVPILTNQTGGDGLLQYIDTSATNSPYRFYRARLWQ